MEGQKTKYYFYEERGSGSVTIPVSMAKGLNWKHKDELTIIFDPEEDSLRFYMLGKKGRQKVEHIGAKPVSDPVNDALIL